MRKAKPNPKLNSSFKSAFEFEFEEQQRKHEEEVDARLRLGCGCFFVVTLACSLTVYFLRNVNMTAPLFPHHSLPSKGLPVPEMEPLQMNHYDEIHFWDIRQAGGSSLRLFLEQVAEKHQLAFRVNEGTCWPPNWDKFPPKQQKKPGTRTLFLTLLGDPIARAEFTYWREEGNVNYTNPHSFRNWLNFNQHHEEKGWRKRPEGLFLWTCVSDCLTKYFGKGLPLNLTMAKHSLVHDFELIVQSNRLSDPNYAQWLAKTLDAKGIALPPPQRIKGKSTVAGPSLDDYEELKLVNQLDYQLLDYVIRKRPDLSHPI